MKERENYYRGYLAALQDMARLADERLWSEIMEHVDDLTRNSVRDLIRETQIEDTTERSLLG